MISPISHFMTYYNIPIQQTSFFGDYATDTDIQCLLNNKKFVDVTRSYKQ